MKYIISLIILSGVLLFRPWNINRNQADMMETTEERPMEDTLIPIHDIIHNYYSDLSETKRLDATIERFMNQWEIKGASLAIMKDGKLIYSKGYGYADEESQTKVDVSHIFRIASISKLITATGIMKLVESDKLSLEDKVFGENRNIERYRIPSDQGQAGEGDNGRTVAATQRRILFKVRRSHVSSGRNC